MYMARVYHVQYREMSDEFLDVVRDGSCWHPVRLLADGEAGPCLFSNLKTLTIDFGGLDLGLDLFQDHFSVDRAVLVDRLIEVMAGRKIKTENLQFGGIAKADAEKLLLGLYWGSE